MNAYNYYPGEYTMTTGAQLDAGDSIFVNGQLYGPDGVYQRSIVRTTRRLIGPSLDGSGDVYTFTRMPIFGTPVPAGSSQDSVRPHVFRTSADGVVLDSFPVFHAATGLEVTVHMGHTATKTRTWFTGSPVLSPDGTVWTTVSPYYRFEQHRRDGSTSKLIGVSLPGYVQPMMTKADVDSLVKQLQQAMADRNALGLPNPGTPTHKLDLQIAADGLLWVTRRIRAPRADTIKVDAEYLSPDEAPGEKTIPRNTEDRLSHTVIEIIDPVRGELIARKELPFLGVNVAPGFVARVRVNDAGHYIVYVYRLRLRRD